MHDTPAFAHEPPSTLPGTLRRQLAPGEQLLWQGRPRQGLLLSPQDRFLIPFSLLWCGFALFWEWSVIQSGAGGFFVLWGVPFVLLGLYIVAGRFWVDARRRARTHYALTSERVLIASGAQIQSLPLRQLPAAQLSLHRAGQGSISFGQAASWNTGLTVLLPPSWPGMPAAAPQFEHIDDAQRVFERLRDAQRRAA